jgi:adenine-specific DNA methylase
MSGDTLKERCPMCGLEFEPGCSETLCSNCTVFRSCKRVRCPRCGYELPREPRFVVWLRTHLWKS